LLSSLNSFLESVADWLIDNPTELISLVVACWALWFSWRALRQSNNNRRFDHAHEANLERSAALNYIDQIKDQPIRLRDEWAALANARTGLMSGAPTAEQKETDEIQRRLDVLRIELADIPNITEQSSEKSLQAARLKIKIINLKLVALSNDIEQNFQYLEKSQRIFLNGRF